MKKISKKLSAVSKKNFPLYIAFDQQLQDGNDVCFYFSSDKERTAFLDGMHYMQNFCRCHYTCTISSGVYLFDLSFTFFKEEKDYKDFVQKNKLKI